ncbi:hypothetical protein TNCT_374391 [Trichonephila clavata]|uniref:Secreted protein n=1 Tax=Trichonephila clavata TaxID=2740835 RepID=A0A8X6K7K3_TRICU|nr:hypothetical protein TNCT_374391 [Trichonephila clavata]
MLLILLTLNTQTATSLDKTVYKAVKRNQPQRLGRYFVAKLRLVLPAKKTILVDQVNGQNCRPVCHRSDGNFDPIRPSLPPSC